MIVLKKNYNMIDTKDDIFLVKLYLYPRNNMRSIMHT